MTRYLREYLDDAVVASRLHPWVNSRRRRVRKASKDGIVMAQTASIQTGTTSGTVRYFSLEP